MTTHPNLNNFIDGREPNIFGIVFNSGNVILACPDFFSELLLGHSLFLTRLLDHRANFKIRIPRFKTIS